MNEKLKSAIPDRLAPSHRRDHSLLHHLSQTISGSGLNKFSIVDLVNKFGPSSQGLFERLKLLQQYGVEFTLLDQEYCQLSQVLDLLDVAQINAGLSENNITEIAQIKLRSVADSTNQILSESTVADLHAVICLAEYQTAGRGRHGRRWVAPYAAGLCLSLGWCLPTPIERLQMISLLPGIALMRVLRNWGLAQQAGLKWPNDVICDGRKLAGILVEAQIEEDGMQPVIIGIGMNVYNSDHHRQAELMSEVQQPWLALSDLADNHQILSRNQLTVDLTTELVRLLSVVEKEGFSSALEEWRTYDHIRNKQVKLILPDHKINGVARGITEDGALMLEVDGVIKEFVSGELSLRLMGETTQ